MIFRFLSAGFLLGQMLVVDRPRDAQADHLQLGRAGAAGFVGDHFTVGTPGQVWFIDAIRVWAVPGSGAVKMGDAFRRVSLFGGIESKPPQPGEPECDCHNLMTIRAAAFRPGTNETDTVPVSAAGDAWQLDFKDLHWSVPGGVPIEFGVMGEARSNGAKKAVWSLRGTKTAGREMKLFDAKGKYTGDDERAGSVDVQVWAHLSIQASIRAMQPGIEVVVEGGSGIDPASVQFGPKSAAPASTVIEGGAMVLGFRPGDAGVGKTDLTACVTGRMKEGPPFEGCALIPR